MRKPIQIIIGGQYGSEAKGAAAGYLAVHEGVDIAVRTGATNAGHTVHYTDASGTTHAVAMQQVPCGWVNPDTVLVLGAGSLIDLDVLQRECDQVTALTGADVRSRLLIDERAYIHRHEHKERSTYANRHHAIGATGKGCSEALVDRIRLRGVEDWTVRANCNDERLNGATITDTERFLNGEWDRGALIQLEGTQGQLLDLYLGPYPYTTHKQTGPAQWLLECGLSPALPVDIVMVIRTCPIRVAGNSGPLPQETSWPELARWINERRDRARLDPIVAPSAIREFERAVTDASTNFELPPGSDGLDQHHWTPDERSRYRITLSELNKVALANLSEAAREEVTRLFELTTVTKKLRRIARLDYGMLRVAARQVRPSRVVLTFLNYEFPERWFTSEPLSLTEQDYVAKVGAVAGAPIVMVNRGPAPEHLIQVEQGVATSER